MSSAFGWVGTACHFVLVNDDAVLSLSLSATNPTKGTRHVALVKTQIVSHE
jgi:hypothetical protein